MTETTSLIMSSARLPNTPAALPLKDTFLRSTHGSFHTCAYGRAPREHLYRRSYKHKHPNQQPLKRVYPSNANVSISLPNGHGVTSLTWNVRHMQPMTPRSQVSEDRSKVKVRASRRVKAKVRARARAKASLKTRASHTSRLPHGRAAERVRAKHPSKDHAPCHPRSRSPHVLHSAQQTTPACQTLQMGQGHPLSLLDVISAIRSDTTRITVGSTLLCDIILGMEIVCNSLRTCNSFTITLKIRFSHPNLVNTHRVPILNAMQ